MIVVYEYGRHEALKISLVCRLPAPKLRAIQSFDTSALRYSLFMAVI